MLKTMLETLLETMKASEQTEVFMREYISSADLILTPLVDKPSLCGAPACILGEQALKFNYDVFPITYGEEVLGYIRDIQEAGDRECCLLLGFPNLWHAIVGALAPTRMHFAERSALFTDKELKELKHLHVGNPKLEDVILFLELCISKV